MEREREESPEWPEPIVSSRALDETRPCRESDENRMKARNAHDRERPVRGHVQVVITVDLRINDWTHE